MVKTNKISVEVSRSFSTKSCNVLNLIFSFFLIFMFLQLICSCSIKKAKGHYGDRGVNNVADQKKYEYFMVELLKREGVDIAYVKRPEQKVESAYSVKYGKGSDFYRETALTLSIKIFRRDTANISESYYKILDDISQFIVYHHFDVVIIESGGGHYYKNVNLPEYRALSIERSSKVIQYLSARCNSDANLFYSVVGENPDKLQIILKNTK